MASALLFEAGFDAEGNESAGRSAVSSTAGPPCKASRPDFPVDTLASAYDLETPWRLRLSR
jgi:hypothetical protein